MEGRMRFSLTLVTKVICLLVLADKLMVSVALAQNAITIVLEPILTSQQEETYVVTDNICSKMIGTYRMSGNQTQVLPICASGGTGDINIKTLESGSDVHHAFLRQGDRIHP
jgi:hypothetical protein